MNRISIDVFGESHFHKDEVSRIQLEVIKLKPDIILLENYEDDLGLYIIALPKVKILNLEENVIFKEKDSLNIQFRDREFNMLNNINAQLPKVHFWAKLKICIVVGDTHLRTIETKELGKPILSEGLITIGCNIDTILTIHRSKYKEIE